MSKVLRAVGQIAGVVATVAAFIPGGQGIAAIAGAVSAVSSIGAQALAKPPAAKGQITERIIGANNPLPYLMGRSYSGGVQVHDVGYGGEVNDVDNPYRFLAVVHSCAGPVEQIESTLANFSPVTFSGTAAVGYYNDYWWRDTQLGARPEADALAPNFAGAPRWGASYKLSGFCAVGHTFKWSKRGKRFGGGQLPIVGEIVRGVKVYDPRLDSTYPGGSGAHRINNEATWTYSRNPALHALTYAYGRYVNGVKVLGVDLGGASIDLASAVAWANTCDANGWNCDGTIYEPGNKWDNLKRICAAGGAVPVLVGGVLRFDYQAPRTALATITRDDLASGPLRDSLGRGWKDRHNTIVPRYRSANHQWEYVQSDAVTVAAFVTEDGEIKRDEIQYDLVTDKDQAAELATYELYQRRELGPINLPLKPHFRSYDPGDCFTLSADLSPTGAAIKVVMRSRSIDVVNGIINCTFETENDTKHVDALGALGTEPTSFTFPTAEELDDTAAINTSAANTIYSDGLTSVEDLRPAEPGGTRNVARGTYDAGTAYVRGDEVIFSGSSYRLIVDTSTGNAPPDVARWALLANAGSGPAGADGLPGLTLIVSNEAHVVATAQDGSGGDYSAAGGQMRVLRGDTLLSPTFSIAAATPATSWITINTSTGVYTVTDPGVDLATATIRATWAGVNYDRTYTLAKSKQGVTGPRLALVADNQAFTFTDGAANPASQTITLTALLNNLSGTATWSTTPAVTLGGTGNTRTLSIANFGTNRQVTIEATLGGITDRITIVRLERSRVAPTGAALNTGHATDSLALWYVNGVETTPLTAPSANASFSLQTPGDVPVGLSSILATETVAGIRNILSNRIPLDPTKTYKLSAWVRTTGDRTLRLTCAFQDAAGANITPAGAGLTGWSFGTFAYWGFAGSGHPAGVWQYYEITMGPLGMATTPANGRTFAVGFTYGDGGTTPTDLEFAGYRVEELTALDAGGPLLVGTLPPGRVEGDFGGNFIADPIFGEGWVYSNAAYSPGLSGGNLYDRHRAVFLGEGVIWFVGSGFPELERAAVTVGETYYFSGWFFRAPSATGHVTARVELYDATGANIGVEDIPGTSTVGMATNAWTRLQGQWTCPSGVAYVRPLVGNNTGGNTSTIFVGLPYFGRHQPGADVTATAQRTIEPQFPVIEIKQGEAGHTGNRTVTHTAKRGTASLTGGTWSLPAQNLGAGSASINASTGTVTLSGIVQSGSYTVRYTHTDGLVTEITVNVTFVPLVAAGVGNTANSITKPFSSTSFVAISNDMTIALPAGVTVANLLANAIILEVPSALPAGSTNVEAKWQRETSPGTWADVGAVATASPHPGVIDEGGFPSLLLGSVTCNRSATGLVAGSTQKFRLVARVSGGVTRTVTPFGTVTAGG